MNSQTGVNEILALLDALKSAVRDFAAREEKLQSTFRVQSGAAAETFACQNQAQAAKAAENETSAAAALEADRKLIQSRFEKRKARINRAYTAVNRWVQDEISRCDSEWKDRTKEGVAAAEINRNEALATTTANYNQFQQTLAAFGEKLAELERNALGAFRGYGKFKRLLAPETKWPEPDVSGDENFLFSELQKLSAKVSGDIGRFGKSPLPKLFKFLPVWLLAAFFLAIIAVGSTSMLAHTNSPIVTPVETAISITAFVLVIIIYFIGGHLSAPLAKTIACDFAKMRRLFDVCAEKSVAHLKSEQARIENEFETTKNNFNYEWRLAVRNISDSRSSKSSVISQKAARIVQKNEAWHRAATERIQPSHAESLARLKAEDAAQVRQIAEAHETKMAQIESGHARLWSELETDWQKIITPLCEQLRAANDAAEKVFPAWNDPAWKDWKPPTEFQNAAKFGRLESAIENFAGPLPKDPRLKWPGPQNISAPLLLIFPAQGSILFESGKTAGDDALGAINSIIFRLLATTPPGKLSFTIFDPVGLGQNFSSLMHLADYEEGSINSRIWTQSAQFEEKLAELNEHMEKIIQMYLRNEYATIAEYNAQAGSVAEKYHFLVIASFPVNFSDTAAKRLRNIAANGARCGVFTLIHWDQRNTPPQDFVPDELRKNSVCFVNTSRGFELGDRQPGGMRLLLDSPPPPEVATEFLVRVGEGSKNANRVEVPFEQIAPAELWQEETTEILRVPIGRSGATKFQYLEIGSGTRQHALIAGKTGSGKSTLFHVIITNLALRCSPEEVEFYLIDFKKGVEFKCYGSRKLPHARVVAIESDREFGLSVLQRLDEELRRRGDLFRKVGAQDLAGYKRAGGTEPVPRSLLMIDEFQEFFTEEDRISQGAAVLLDRIVRQGRAFGIHVILGSQTLGGAYTLARATIGQMVIRIALQCNEADAYLIMDQDNPAPRLLSRPGEGIYNDAAGAIEGNSPFQAVWLSDKTRDEYLAKIRERADAKGNQYPGPIVFEGNAPADVRENNLLADLLKSSNTFSLSAPSGRGEGRGEVRENLGHVMSHHALTPHPNPLPSEGRGNQIPTQSRIWLGAPNSIKGPTEAVFRRQSGSNLLVVGQSEERTTTIVAVSLVSLAAQFPKDDARFVLLDSTPPGFPQREFLERIIRSIPHETILGGNSNLAEVMNNLAEELKRRGENESSGPEIFVLIHGLQNFKKLRAEDEFSFSSSSGDAPNPAAILSSLITEGPARGIHVIVTCDTYNNMSRFLGRKALGEFEMRVVFQMSAADSASLIDAPAASTLGMNRALYYNDREGSLETFRPYAQPDGGWIENIEHRHFQKNDLGQPGR